ncbi:hypothetical protein A4R26_23050 [Niastella populi]|uniref:Uncharacterized protein n=1 Tax=Niastella populi TaxID=550983 RepID=A0A1V9FHY8_9BACT|nr:hypothetical protein A4R26_23050 [Niastella populi]
MDHRKKSIIWGNKKRKLAIISQPGKCFQTGLRRKINTSRKRFTIIFSANANKMPRISTSETASEGRPSSNTG